MQVFNDQQKVEICKDGDGIIEDLVNLHLVVYDRNVTYLD